MNFIKNSFILVFMASMNVFTFAQKNREVSPNGSGPFLIKDAQKNILLSWTEKVGKATFILKYVEIDAKNNKKGKIKTVTPSKGMQSHAESMPKVAKTASGITYAIFRRKAQHPKSRFGGHIFYAISTDDGETWSEKQQLVTEKGAKSQSFYDVALLSDGELGMSWLDSRKLEKNKDGSTLYFAKTEGIKGFVNQKPLAGSTCQCCRTEIYSDTKGKIHIAFRNIIENSVRDMFSVSSSDNGTTFTTPSRIAKDNWVIYGCPHTGPSLADFGKEVAAVWFTGAESGSGIFFKKLTNKLSFYETKQLISSTGRHPQMIALKNGEYNLVYEEPYKLGEEEYNHIILHTIHKNGRITKKKITQKGTDNDHAVITQTRNGKILIAWVTTDTKTFITKVVYTILDR